MRLSKTKNRKRALIILIVIAAVIAGLAYLWLRNTASNNNASPATQQSDKTRKVNDVDYSPPTDDEKKQQEQQKEEIIQQATSPNTSSSVAVSISRASQADAGQPLVIRAIVDGTSSGTCDVTLSKEGYANIVKSFAITADATYSVCSNAQLQASEFPSGGAWKLQIVARSGSNISQPATLNVTITK